MKRTFEDDCGRGDLPRGRHAAHARQVPPCHDEKPREDASSARPQETYSFSDEVIDIHPVAPRKQPSHEGLVRRRHSKRTKRARRVALGAAIVLAALIVVGGISGCALASSAKSLQAEGRSALGFVDALYAAVVSGDYESAHASANNLAQTADRMAEELDSPMWAVAGALPFVGQDVRGVQTMAGVLRDASHEALVPLASALVDTPLSALVSAEGAFDIEALDTLLASVAAAAPTMQRLSDEMAALPPMRIERLASLASSAKDKIIMANEAFQQITSFASVADAVLGGSGERTYLVMAQNSAELRAAGGFPGSVGVMTISNGRIELGEFSSISEVLDWQAPASATITPVETELFEGHMSASWDACFNPDFPRCASIWAEAYKERNGVAVDGVLSMTPAVVQKILAIAGPVVLADGTQLDGNTATRVLQHDLYWKYLSGESTGVDDSTANALFAQAASLSFDAMLDSLSSGTLVRYASVLSDSISSREFMLWLSDPAEQEKIAQIGCSGALSNDPSEPEVGVFANIWLASKMGWYFDIETTVGPSVRNADGTTSYQVTTTFSNAATAQEAHAGGWYLMGKYDGYETGDIAPFLYFYAPAQGSISQVSATGDAGVFASVDCNGRQVVYSKWTHLLPGDTISCTYTVTVSAQAEEELAVMTMPTLTAYRVAES